MPRRPGWAKPREIAYRSRIFGRFRGFLTYGSPLEKFAGLWPALVPISRERAFDTNIPWLNVYDPIDPVSGRLLAFKGQLPACCPIAQDLGYAASWWLLVAHLKYFTRRRDGNGDLATLAVRWMLTDDAGVFGRAPLGLASGGWFRPDGWQVRLRRAIAWFTWIAAAAALGLLGAVVLPMLSDAAVTAVHAIWVKVVQLTASGGLHELLDAGSCAV